MHYNSFHDSCLSLKYSPSQAEVVYRSEACPLPYLHNSRIIHKKTNSTSHITNCVAPIKLGRSTKGLIASFGCNQSEIEAIGVGGQQLRKKTTNFHHDPLSLEQCFQDVLKAEYPNFDFSSHATPGSSKGPRTFTISDDPLRYLNFPPSNNHSKKPFRFKRLAEFRPRCFDEHSLIEILVDDKIAENPFVYARGHGGLSISQLHVTEHPTEEDGNNSGTN